MKKSEKIVRSILGDLYEPLYKAIVKMGTKSVVDIGELHDSLAIVPKSIIAFLISVTKDMEVGEAKESTLPWDEESGLLLNKHAEDVYAGHIVQAGKVVHEFSLCSIPQLAAHLLSFSEMYDESPEGEAKEESQPQDEPKLEESSIDVKEHLKLLDNKINALMMIVANQPVQKAEESIEMPKDEFIEEHTHLLDVLAHPTKEKLHNEREKQRKELAGKLKKCSLKKAGLMPKMPSPPKPGTKVGGNQGITKEGLHGDKTAATDTNTKPVTQMKNPDMKVSAMPKMAQPKQPKSMSTPQKTPKVAAPKAAAPAASPPTAKSEKELSFKKSELVGQCADCGGPVKRCNCFRALSQPQMKKSEKDIVTFKFAPDWDSDSLSALYKSIKRRRNV